MVEMFRGREGGSAAMDEWVEGVDEKEWKKATSFM